MENTSNIQSLEVENTKLRTVLNNLCRAVVRVPFIGTNNDVKNSIQEAYNILFPDGLKESQEIKKDAV